MNDARRLTVLIADAHEHYRGGLVRAIASHPGLVVGAVTDDGAAALSLIINQRPDLALLDVRLPQLDGFAISQRLVSYEPRLPTQVVLLTAVLDRAQHARARSAGAVGCLSKDTSRREICQALLAAAGSQQPARETRHLLARTSFRSPTPAVGRESDPDDRAA